MAELGLTEVEVQTLWEYLERERYVDERRYARAFANDKVRLERRGRQHIRQALRQKGVSAAVIEQTLHDLDPEEYAVAFRQLLAQKRRHYAGQPNAHLKVRAALFRAGFELELFEEMDDSET
jgi:regulatory protein